MSPIVRDLQYHKFRAYGFLKNLRLFDPFLILFLRDAGLSFLAIGTLVSVRMIAFAVGETFRSGTHKAMILEHLRQSGQEDAKVAYYGKTRAASQLGSALASLLAAGLVFWTGSYRIIFLGTLVPYLLDFVLLASYPRALDGAHMETSQHGWHVFAVRFRQTVEELLHLIRATVILRGLLSSASFDALFKTTKDYLQPVVRTQALALALPAGWNGDRRTAVLIGAVHFLVYAATSVTSAVSAHVHARLHSPARAVNLTPALWPCPACAGGAWAVGRVGGRCHRRIPFPVCPAKTFGVR